MGIGLGTQVPYFVFFLGEVVCRLLKGTVGSLGRLEGVTNLT